MAWTSPRTWVTGEVVTAAQLNTHLRDNLLEIGPHKRIAKNDDEAITNSSAVQDDDHLQFPIAANETWVLMMPLLLTQGAGLFKMTITVPAGASGEWSFRSDPSNIHGIAIAFGTEQATTFAASEIFTVYARVVNGGTGGDVKLRWAQSASNAAATTLKAGSMLLAHRIG